VIVAVTKCLAAFSQAGRTWPVAEAFDGTLSLDGYSVEGGSGMELRLASLFRHLPVAVLRARFDGALKPARKRLHA
jgi:(1->4)-alpha-D-glucan 1-alpha-D-glucosylmutase